MDHREELAERVFWACHGRMLATARETKSLQVGNVVYVDVIEGDWSVSTYRIEVTRED